MTPHRIVWDKLKHTDGMKHIARFPIPLKSIAEYGKIIKVIYV